MNKQEMFKKNMKLQKSIDNIYNQVNEDTYGASYSWSELEQLSNFKLEKKELYYILTKVNTLLMANNARCLKTIPGFGKRLLKPNEHLLESRKVAKQAVKKYKKAGVILASTNMEELSQEEQTSTIEAANKFRTLEMFTQELTKRKKISSTEMDKDSQRFILDFFKLFGEIHKK